MNTALMLNSTLTYPRLGLLKVWLLISSKTCAFLTKIFHEIRTLSKERDYLSNKASREKMITALISNNTWTCPKLGFLILE